MKIATIVGARPQFIKAAGLGRELRKRHTEILIHTGQHYDYAMSGVFFDGLDLPAPEVSLGVGSGSHGAQTGAMLAAVEKVLQDLRPDWVLVFGDTNSTLAGALAAAKLHLPVVHVEAGLRSYNRRMPEEINRVLTDHVSEILLCPSQVAVVNLAAEGITDKAHVVGDVMLDILTWARERVNGRGSALLEQLSVRPGRYLVATIHRGENTDDPERLGGIVQALNNVSEEVVFPVHPRTRKVLDTGNSRLGSHVKMIEPLGYMEMVALSASARAILTDSGGLQKEAYWLGVPCVTLRDETEWVETVASGWNRLAGCSPEKISNAIASTFERPEARGSLYGEGCVAAKCVDLIEKHSLAKKI
jgi:UDP-N-acetylglucosamine 2-epimerase